MMKALIASAGTIAACWAAGAQATPLQAGAAKVEITPPAAAFPNPQNGPPEMKLGARAFVGVHDPLWARALVVSDGTDLAAIVSMDLERVPRTQQVIERIAAATGIPAGRIVLSAIETHNEPMTQPAERDGTPKYEAYFTTIERGAIQAVQAAKKALGPARMGYGDDGRPGTGRMALLKFERMDGQPIALMLNYPLKSGAAFRALTRPDGYEVSGDIAGMTESLVERHAGDKVIALYTTAPTADGAADWIASRFGVPGTDGTPGDYGAATWAIVEAQARRLAQRAEDLARATPATDTQARIWGEQRPATCPGQKASGTYGEATYQTAARPPVRIPLGVLAINDIAIAWVGGDLAMPIADRAREASALNRTLMVQQAGGSVGYLLQDASYGTFSHAVMASPVGRGCAEPAVVGAVRDLTTKYVAARP